MHVDMSIATIAMYIHTYIHSYCMYVLYYTSIHTSIHTHLAILHMTVCAKGGYRIQTHDALNLEIQSMLSAQRCWHMFYKRRTRGRIFQAKSLDCNKRGDLTVLNLSQSTVKQDGKKPTTLPFVPDNPDGRISELLLDTTVVHPLPGPNSKHKLSLIEAKQNLRAADKACARKK